ncbi:unnamed protein product [Aspergillus oryzae]|uniref:Unnamed protein product n=1 Tax=Aspergillus oryzae TaxID=5062 RepID=A0AAN4YB06_ASPOZ|nr:unnamed protein product [Aspergillus oryzae]GMF93688.1 unnamed protein product [Aspergillus oryzae]GMG08894.1 unnamed protein product [Aspergillus oryzae]GMG24780.1 unnamed protein product [Aspergillus oryzae]
MPVPKQNRSVDTDNIQGSIWPRLPKYYETYLFFKITDNEKFRQHLRGILDKGVITTGTECEEHLKSVGEFEEACAYSRRHVPEKDRKPFTAVNVAFTHMGLLKVEHPEVEVNFAQALAEDPDEYCRDRINEGLFEKGMFDDLVYEGADSPPALDPDFRAPPGNESKTGLDRWKWRVDGVFIVAAHNAKALRRKIVDLEDAFNVGDADENSMKIAFRRDERCAPEPDIISLVTAGRELIYDTGAPVAKAIHEDNPDLAFDNTFDFRPKKDIKGCPFAAHIRKMRPRADKKRDFGSEEDDENHKPLPEPGEDEAFDEGQKEDASVILRRGITFGPELTAEEISKGETIEHRGILPPTFESPCPPAKMLINIGWASNSSFPEYKTKTFPDGPGMDPFINQRLRTDHPEGHISLYDGSNPNKTVKLDLGLSPWVDQKGGEYFFTPSIRALREQFSADTVNTEGESEDPEEDPVVKKLQAKIDELEQEQKALLKITEERVADIENLEAQLKEAQESHQKFVEETRKGTVVGYAGLIHLDFLNKLETGDLRQLKHQVRDALAQLAGDVDWKTWQRTIRELNSKYGFDLLYGNGGHYEGRHWREWKEIQYSTSNSDYDRTVAFRNRMGQWCNNAKWKAEGGDAAGCALMWLTFVIQLHDVLQVYRPDVC